MNRLKASMALAVAGLSALTFPAAPAARAMAQQGGPRPPISAVASWSEQHAESYRASSLQPAIEFFHTFVSRREPSSIVLNTPTTLPVAEPIGPPPLTSSEQKLEMLDKIAIGVGLVLFVAYFWYRRSRPTPDDDDPDVDGDDDESGPGLKEPER